MSIPSCRHAKRKTVFVHPLVWLGNEPYRLFFLSGILFSIAGVMLWPMLYRGMLDFYPATSHARVMIQAFGGGFVLGFLGTAAPRMMGAPRLSAWELVVLFTLHLAGGISHLRGLNFHGDVFFLILLVCFALALGVRVIAFRKESPPPPLVLAAAGILCGISGTLLWLNPEWMKTTAVYRLAGLLLNQGFLLGPVMGVGIFFFPRLLGQSFGEPAPGAATRKAWRTMSIVALVLLLSFGVEVWFHAGAGLVLRVATFLYALAQVRWLPQPDFPKAGTLANALRIWCVPLALAGLSAPIFAGARHVAYNHLLFVGGFGLVCLIAASRVLFGHSGRVERFANRSWVARLIVGAVVIAALTRLSADFLPRVTISHYEYAAWSWAAAAALWTGWHARRFFKKDETEE